MADRSTQDQSRRRFARRQWARRWLAWRPVLATVLVLGAVGFAIYGLYFSSWLTVEGAEVSGTSQLAEAEVLDAAELPIDEALVTVDLDEIEARVDGRLTAVKSVDASRQWPHEIRIEIEEWRPLAVVIEGSSFTFLAESGDTFTFEQMPKEPPVSLPQVKLGSQADRLALQEAAAVVASLDDEVARLVDHIEVETADEILLELRDGREVRWGSAAQSDEKAVVLLNLLDARPEAQTYDVSVPSLPAAK
ncbi:cell division protein FtsQ/DivIB [Nocardioides bizhenqiangii]|uniref:FtsQ-type POTRA domain-containing protein n=1 Tax=Nocardioides bizhenqiangii TaxID=3095076 RepID=A0ABZ0ZL58_9ACTN|nr:MULTISPECIES: FtsQ-type POTRA domain-containing protein [unclassified Nocardioides]MDZ5620643.1 FtsQ-type POTRA domain-containing protein [Nocardioides sp. HM23]WQQ25010.1 FtsQ-type POTRA domain-containing protein [Nocardioides sp. HM61]